jgi:hypothetical protein
MSEIKYRVSSSPASNSNSLGGDKLLPEFEVILRDAVLVGGFRNRLPEGETQHVPKLFLRAQKFLYALQKGTLLEEYKFDAFWLQKHAFDFSIFKKDNLPELVHRAARRFGMMRKEGFWPPEKETLTPDISVFLFHPKTHKSWFLYCAFNRVQLIDDPSMGGMDTAFDAKFDLTEDERKVLLKHRRLEWDEKIFLAKAAQLLAWYKQHEQDLKVYNLHFSDMAHIWWERFGDISSLLDTLGEYAKRWPHWTLGNFGWGNKTWSRFVDFCRKAYKIELEPAEPWLRYAYTAKAQYDKARKEKEEERRREKELDIKEEQEYLRRKKLGLDLYDES